MSTNPLTTLPELPDTVDAATILRVGLNAVTGPVALACSFSREDIVLIDMLRQHHREVRVFALDTGRLNEETLEIAETIRLRYEMEIDWYFPERTEVEQLERDKGLFSFRDSLENRHQCCHIRKVEPLRRALHELAGWITGQRRIHGVTRGELQPLEIDQANGGILKLNPLAHWSDEQVEDYIRRQRLSVNRLYQQGYQSIGCAPCTRAVAPGDDPRSGRWWWESPEHKECGLHRS